MSDRVDVGVMYGELVWSPRYIAYEIWRRGPAPAAPQERRDSMRLFRKLCDDLFTRDRARTTEERLAAIEEALFGEAADPELVRAFQRCWPSPELAEAVIQSGRRAYEIHRGGESA